MFAAFKCSYFNNEDQIVGRLYVTDYKIYFQAEEINQEQKNTVILYKGSNLN